LITENEPVGAILTKRYCHQGKAAAGTKYAHGGAQWASFPWPGSALLSLDLRLKRRASTRVSTVGRPGRHKTVTKPTLYFGDFACPQSCNSVTALAVMPLFTDGQTIDMPISILDLDGNVTKVVLAGRIDIAGAREIEMPMAVVAGSRRAVVVDLSAVEFMASLGLRGIVVSARSIISKRGRIVLLMPQPQVEEVITTTGIDQLIPIYHDETDAIAAVITTTG
jgi:anti-anti-sigma factor